MDLLLGESLSIFPKSSTMVKDVAHFCCLFFCRLGRIPWKPSIVTPVVASRRTTKVTPGVAGFFPLRCVLIAVEGFYFFFCNVVVKRWNGCSEALSDVKLEGRKHGSRKRGRLTVGKVSWNGRWGKFGEEIVTDGCVEIPGWNWNNKNTGAFLGARREYGVGVLFVGGPPLEWQSTIYGRSWNTLAPGLFCIFIAQVWYSCGHI